MEGKERAQSYGEVGEDEGEGTRAIRGRWNSGLITQREAEEENMLGWGSMREVVWECREGWKKRWKQEVE